MTSTDWYTVIGAAVPLIVALTAWLRAETANKSAKAATAAVAAKTTPPA